MKKTLLGMAATALLVMAMQASAAPPHRGGGYYRHHGWHGGYWGPRVGVYYGPGFGYGFPYAYGVPYPYAAGYPFAYAPVVISSTPVAQTYIQQETVAEAAVQAAPTVNYWYYCTQPAGYFPYVQHCNQPWMKVIPQNPVNPQ